MIKVTNFVEDFFKLEIYFNPINLIDLASSNKKENSGSDYVEGPLRCLVMLGHLQFLEHYGCFQYRIGMYGLMQYLYMNLQYWAKYNETNYDLNLTAAFFGDRERYLEQSF